MSFTGTWANRDESHNPRQSVDELMIQWEVFFLYYHDTDDVDHDYGDYYDDVHEPMMYSFRWIVIVMVIMLQNYKKRWLNILWRSFLSVLAKQTKKKKTFDILMCTNFHESFPLTIRGDISQYIQIAPNIWVQSGFSKIQWLNTMTWDLFHSWSIWIETFLRRNLTYNWFQK